MRDHRAKKPGRRFESFAHHDAGGGAILLQRFKRVGQLADARDGAVEAEFVDIVGNRLDRLVRQTADRRQFRAEVAWHRSIRRR